MNRSSSSLKTTARAASLALAAVLLAPGVIHADALPLYIADPTANEKPASGIFLILGEGNVKRSLTLAAEKRWGNDYMHARYYSPNLGRFMSVDPVGGEIGNSQSWNRYSYVLNNPIGLIDPDGEAPHGALTEMKIREGMTLAEVEQFNEIQQQVERPAAMVALAFMPGPDDALMAVALGTRATRALGSVGRAIKNFFSKGDAAVDAAKPAVKAVEGQAGKTTGLQKQLDTHLKRLEDYKANPDKFDNKGFLKDASPERRQKIIDGRVRNLEKQITDFRKQIDEAAGSN